MCYNDIDCIDCNFCPKCGKWREAESDLCHDCSTKVHYFDSGRGMYIYEGAVKQSLFGLKFFNQTWIGARFGKLMAEFYKEQCLPEVDLVLPIPLHYFRYLKRGYNQAEILGRHFSEFAHLPYDSHIIWRSKWTKPQKDLSDIERIHNMSNAFSIRKNKQSEIKGKKILLIDDIYTTGTTIDSCSKLLYEYGAENVYFLTIAIGNGI